MECDRCGEREATIHEVVIRNGQQTERHLCERCASEGSGSQGPQGPIHELISKYVVANKGEGALEDAKDKAPRPGTVCDRCGLPFAEFKQSGLLGCPRCYDAFTDRLGPLIERAHEGATTHVGKVPRRALEQTRRRGGSGLQDLVGNLEERAGRERTIREQLGRAIEAEQYERAAKLRDELDKLSSIDPATGSGEPGPDSSEAEGSA